MGEAWIYVRPVNMGAGEEGSEGCPRGRGASVTVPYRLIFFKTRVTVVPVGVDIQTLICSGPLVVNIIQCLFF